MGKALLVGHACEVLVEVAPFLSLAGSCGGKVGAGVADHAGGVSGGDFHCSTLQQREELLGMAEFLLGGFEEYGGYLFVAFLLGLGGKEGVARACLTFAGERCQQVVFGAGAFYTFCRFHSCIGFLFVLS